MENFLKMNKLFESLDEKVFTPELKEQLEAEFNAAVEDRANLIAESKLEDEKVNLDKICQEYKQQLDESYRELVSEKEKEFEEKYQKLSEAYVNECLEEINEKVAAYTDDVVNDFVNEIKDTLSNDVSIKRSEAIIECVKAQTILTAVKLDDLEEAEEKLHEEDQATVESLQNKINTLMNENIELKNTNNELLKAGIINEVAEGLNVVEAEKFKNLAESFVEFTNDKSYIEKLEALKESVISKNTIKTEPVNESKKKENDAPWKRFC